MAALKYPVIWLPRGYEMQSLSRDEYLTWVQQELDQPESEAAEESRRSETSPDLPGE